MFRSTPPSVTMRRHDKASVELATHGQGVGDVGKIRLPSDEDRNGVSGQVGQCPREIHGTC